MDRNPQSIDGKATTMAAPRLQWMRVNGKPQDGMDICHTCDYRPCINPDHLFEGTPYDNMHDMIAKKRDVRVKGVEHGNAKLTDAQISAIRIDGRPLRKIAADHGITASNVYWIKKGTTRKHVA
jgi:hypothetical protein